MTLTTLSWLAFAAYALHILEEYTFDWRNWARRTLKLPVEWNEFYITNAVVIVLGLVQAELAPSLPLAPLSYAALMLINATFFHVLPVIRAHGRFSPGLVTGLALFYPIGIAEFIRAREEAHLSTGVGVSAFLVGAVLMAFPIVMLRLRERPYFRQDRE